MSASSDAIAMLERSLKFATGMHDALAAKFAALVEENKSLTADLPACAARYNEAVLDGVRMREALKASWAYITGRNIMPVSDAAKALATIDAALSAGRGEGEGE